MNKLTLSETGVLWSKGIGSFCDYNGGPDYLFAHTETFSDKDYFVESYKGCRNLVWLRLSTRPKKQMECDLDLFANEVLQQIDSDFVLITTDGDTAVPSELKSDTVDKILNNQYLKAWFTQNYSGSNNQKIMPFPIGLDLHTLGRHIRPSEIEHLLKAIRFSRSERNESLNPTIFSDFQLNYSHGRRKEIFESIQDNPFITFIQQRVSPFDLWRLYSEFDFVLSPRGNGLDCHRTYEALYLGAIVITEETPISPLFDDLAVIYVTDWEILKDVNILREWKSRYLERTNMDHVWSNLNSHRYITHVRSYLSK